MPENEWKFYRTLKSGELQCLACPRHCHLSDNEIGWCGARICKDGKIFPRTYALISSLASDPIEKKPLYHFLPGTDILSIGSHGCNLGCLHCQNSEISANRSISSLRKMMPEHLPSTIWHQKPNCGTLRRMEMWMSILSLLTMDAFSIMQKVDALLLLI